MTEPRYCTRGRACFLAPRSSPQVSRRKHPMTRSSETRHIAFHRQWVTALELGVFLHVAEPLAKVLDDSRCAEDYATVRQHTFRLIEEFSQRQQLVHTRLMTITQEMKSSRTQLRLSEHLAVRQMVQEAQKDGELYTIDLEQFRPRDKPDSGRSSADVNGVNTCVNHPQQQALRFCSRCVSRLPRSVEEDLRSRQNDESWLSQRFVDTMRWVHTISNAVRRC